MISKTDEIYTQVIEVLPPIERLRLVSLVLRNLLQQNSVAFSDAWSEEGLSERSTFSLIESMAEDIEDFCLNRAMDEAAATPLLGREDALAFLAEESD